MSISSCARRALLITMVAAGTACDGTALDPEQRGVPEERLSVLTFADSAPPPLDTVVSFWAVRGENRRVEIELAPLPGEDEPLEFFEFEVPNGALSKYPDGRAFARGDSVLITITIVDPTRFLFRFEPAGLVFSSDSPAQLDVSYEWARRDDDEDVTEWERTFGFWRQERPGELWYRVATVTIEDLDEVEADVFGFTRYALASN